jgi:hypothetical protein
MIETGDVVHTGSLLVDSLDKIPTLSTSHSSSNETRIPNLSYGNPDIHDSLHNHATKKTVPLSGIETHQQLFDTESFFKPRKPFQELNGSNYHAVEKGGSVSSPENADPSLKDYVPSTDPFSLSHEKKSLLPEGILQSKSQGELFQSGLEEHSDDLFSLEKVDDLFLTAKTDCSRDSVGDGDLFSSSTKNSLSKENKSRTFVDKSDVSVPKETHDDGVDILFVPGDEHKNKDLFSNSVVPNSGLFGEDSPETDDLFTAASKKKVGNSVIKGKTSGTVATSAKGSLFEDDDDGDLFGSMKPAGVSSVSAKPADSSG